MAPPTVDRRVSGVRDRRRISVRQGGRRAEDHRHGKVSALIPCAVCEVAWASLVWCEHEHQVEQSVATYICPRCGHFEKREADGTIVEATLRSSDEAFRRLSS